MSNRMPFILIFSKFTIFLELFSFFLYAQPVQKEADPLNDSKAVEMFDSLTQSKFFLSLVFRNDFSPKHEYAYPADFIPEYNDSILAARITALNAHSPINFCYNEDVRAHIDFYLKRRSFLSRLIGLTDLYFPLFEEMLHKYDLPEELKFLPIIESALNPVARSRAGAMGLWQFMYKTGLLYGLEVSNFVDDRCDPYKSTDAACRHLKDLYAIYNDWLLALAAYNAGSGRVNRAIHMANGSTNYWEVRKFLPRETQRYVPAFIAATYVMSYYHHHNIRPLVPVIIDAHIDTVAVRSELALDILAQMLDVPLELLEFLNPSYRKNIIPAPVNGKIYYLRLPAQKIIDFYRLEIDLYYETLARRYPQIMADYVTSTGKTIYNKPYRIKGDTAFVSSDAAGDSVKSLTLISTVDDFRQIFHVLTVAPALSVTSSSTAYGRSTSTSRYSYHVVRSGETLSSIARKYGLTVNELMALNNLRTHTIHPGQKLIISRTAQSTSSRTSQSSSAQPASRTSTQLIHTVRSGDTLWNISQKYGVPVEKIMADNNLKSDKLQVGQQLKIIKQ